MEGIERNPEATKAQQAVQADRGASAKLRLRWRLNLGVEAVEKPPNWHKSRC
jgi:hypothetical protein